MAQQSDTAANSMGTQATIVRRWLEAGNSITSYESFLKWRITRLSAVIYILIHHDGLNITGEMQRNPTTNKCYKQYKLS